MDSEKKRVPYTTREKINASEIGINNIECSWKPTKGDPTASLGKMASDLPRIKDNIEYTRNDVSVPSPWANIIFFDSLLQAENNEFGNLNKQAVKDWRTLFTIIALKDVWNIQFEIETVDLLSDCQGFADKDFCANICNMKPINQFLDSRDCWNKFYLIKIDKCTIGALTNSFLVCSAYKENFFEDNYKYAVEYLQSLGFMDRDYNFTDPMEYLKDDFSLLVYMVSYCEKIRELLKRTSTDSATEKFIDIICNKVIGPFIDDLKSNLDSGQTSKCNAITGDSADKLYIFENIDIVINDINDLFKSVKLKAVDVAPVTDIVVDKNNNLLLDNLGDGIGKIEQSGKVKFLHCDEYNIVTNEKIFLKNITLVDCADGILPFKEFTLGPVMNVSLNDEQKCYCCIPPVQDAVFDMFNSYYDVRDNISIEGDYERGIDVSIKFIINGKENIRRKHYDSENYTAISDFKIPFIAIWPYASVTMPGNDFDTYQPAWNDFYVYEEDVLYCAGEDVQPCKVEIKSRSTETDNEIVIFEARREDFDSNRKDGKRRLIAHKKNLPTYIKISQTNNMDAKEELGIILLKKPAINAVINRDKEVFVGMDFGTTSTTAFCTENIGSKNEKFIKFGYMSQKSNIVSKADFVHFKDEECNIDGSIGDNQNGCCIVCRPMSAAENEPATDFIPLQYKAHRFYPSIFKTNVKGNKFDIIRYPNLNGNIIFDSSIVSDNISEMVNRNLKWGKHGDNQLATKGYLSQFMTQVAFTLAKEGVGSIKWRFSYPTALSPRERTNFREDVNGISDKIQNFTGILSTVEGTYTESIVAAKFYSKAHTYICIDIGGGSTDVSLWKGDVRPDAAPVNLLQFSIGIAARKIFTEALANLIINCKDVNDRSRQTLQSYIGRVDSLYEKLIKKTIETISPNGQVVAPSTDKIKEIMENFGREIEPLIQNNGVDIMEWVMAPAICDQTAKDYFFRYIITGFYGILYYTVLSMKEIQDELKAVNNIEIKLAGNGANMYDWLMRYFRSSEQGKKIFGNAMSKLTKKKLGMSINYELGLENKKLKTEAACGLLRMTEKTSAYDQNLITVCGDYMKAEFRDGKVLTLNPTYNLAEDSDLSEFFGTNTNGNITDISLDYEKHSDEIKEFADTLNDYILKDDSDIELNLEDISAKEMQRMIRNVLKRNVTNSTLAPAFILELESMLSILAGYDKDAVVADN